MSLFGICKDYATFCITDANIDVWDANSHPFAIFAQWDHVKELIFLPIQDFHELCAKIDTRNCQLSFLFAMGRSGSTLLGQILHKAPELQILAEPWATVHIHRMYQAGVLSQGQKRKYLRNAVKILCFKYRVSFYLQRLRRSMPDNSCCCSCCGEKVQNRGLEARYN